MELMEQIQKAATAIKNANYVMAFTGAGISVESGVPPFRGAENSVWSKYNPEILQLDYFYSHPDLVWPAIKEIFYNFMFKSEIKPNAAHIVLARMESKGMLKCIVTQNIDYLHQEAGSRNVYEFHGTAGRVVCTGCDYSIVPQQMNLDVLPPRCPKCGKLLKPDFVFFGEGIPSDAYEGSFRAADKADVVIVVGTTGEVMPAGMVPIRAKQHGAIIIEINPTSSAFTERFTDIHIATGAVEAFTKLSAELNLQI